jgi:hypothetical protein
MATIKFFIRSENAPANIYIRLSTERGITIMRKTGFKINPEDWKRDKPVRSNIDKKKIKSPYGMPKGNDADLKNLKTNLDKLKTEIETQLNKAVELKQEIDGDWLQKQIDIINGKKKVTDPDNLLSWIQHYIDTLPNKVSPGGKTGVTRNTIQKYTTVVLI